MVDKRKYQDRTIHTEVRTSQSFDYEVIQRSLAREPVGSPEHAGHAASVKAAKTKSDEAGSHTVGATHEERENPAANPMAGQAGTRQAHEHRVSRPSSTDADRKAMSQNAARISDFDQS